MTLGVMGGTFTYSSLTGSSGCFRSSAWRWFFSSIHSTRGTIGFELKERKIALHAPLRHGVFGRGAAFASMRRAVTRLAVEHLLDRSAHALVIDQSGPTEARLVVVSLPTILLIMSAPISNRGTRNLKPMCNCNAGPSHGAPSAMRSC